MSYWDEEVEPWVHYIPVKADFSNLEETVRYVTNPTNAEQIAWIIKNAQVCPFLGLYVLLEILNSSHSNDYDHNSHFAGPS